MIIYHAVARGKTVKQFETVTPKDGSAEFINITYTDGTVTGIYHRPNGQLFVVTN
jgi:hypothetical protein